MTTAELTTFYKGKRVLVTGHTGFKGAWLLTLLERLGASVQGYALAAEQPALYRDIQGDRLCQSTIGDLLDKELLKQTVASFEPEVVFHLAAQPLVIEAYKSPVYTFEVNAIGTANLLEAIRNLSGACTVINITTDKVYDNKEWYYPYRENDALGGYDPYSASKACAELVSASYRSSFFNPAQYEQHQTALATVRAGNVIGGGDWAANRLIPDIVRAVQAGDEVVLRHPEAVRPWQHVLEALYGYLILGKLLAAHPLKYGTAYNFGPLLDEAVSVEYLVQQAVQLWGRGSYRVERPEDAVHEARLLRLDCSKATQELQWKPKWNAAEAIEQTIEWYRLVLDEGRAPLEVTRSQLSTYLS
jgi:CDP-glucose 4,6-dehydratase